MRWAKVDAKSKFNKSKLSRNTGSFYRGKKSLPRVVSIAENYIAIKLFTFLQLHIRLLNAGVRYLTKYSQRYERACVYRTLYGTRRLHSNFTLVAWNSKTNNP